MDSLWERHQIQATLYIELLYQAFDFTGAFAMSSILVIMAVIILILRNILEHRGNKEGGI